MFCRRYSMAQSSVRSIASMPVVTFVEILSFLVGGREETTIRPSSLSSSSIRSLLNSFLIATTSSRRAYSSQCELLLSEECQCTFCLRNSSRSSSRVRLSSGRSSNAIGLGLLGTRPRVWRSSDELSIVIISLFVRRLTVRTV
jgi:hypothetical protein